MKINLYKLFLILIIIVSIFLRIVIIERTPLNDENQIDTDMGLPVTVDDYEKLFNLNNYEENDHGHLYYIIYLFENHKLCDDTVGQTYHPPLHYVITASWLSIINVFQINAKQKIEGIQYIGLLYFVLSLFIIIKILNELKMPDKSKLLIILLYCFFPKFLLMSTYISNDYLSFCFMIWSLLYLLKWNKEQSLKNTIILAGITGLGVLTKYNAIVMLVPIGISFINKLVENRKEFSIFSSLFFKMIIFTTIISIFSASYIARCFIVLHDYKVAVPYEHLYIGNLSVWQRWGISIKNIFLLKYNPNNVIFGFLYTTLICYRNYNYLIGILNFILIIYSIFYIIKEIKTKNNFQNQIPIITFATYIISYISYNLKLPYKCTYDSRYILIVLFLFILFVGGLYEKIENVSLKRFLLIIILLFCINSTIIFL